MSATLNFAINRISASRQPFPAFAAMCQRLGISAIEIRNDLPGVELQDGTPASDIGAIARDHGLRIRSINALYPFDVFNAERAEQASRLADYAAACGAEALVMCPLNSWQDERNAAQRAAGLVQALEGLRPILRSRGLTGLVEPLGFEECALRQKSLAVQAIQAIGDDGTFRLVHDTFHHHLAGEDTFFPELTGLVHISGVEDLDLGVNQMRDGHRVLVGDADRLGNLPQLRRLLDLGYTGLVSFEPFAESVATAADIEAQLAASMAFIREGVAALATAA
ncbi:TIM barrel protein [Ideonella livida]|uniref:TIM barrel protein n=1 Tax=Ideonella livida TaxID=2707176 RepID=A0A7C9PIL9_9BURK|nr:TIM barrel protein [Ideonella livida]NDY92074.1 TIM barrel protein [Ideonella livida]